MSPTVISVEHLSKAYRLGQIGTGTFTNDLKLWWAKMRGKPNPMLRIGETDHGNRDGEDLWALRDVSFTVEQGEVLGIIGRNGAGKSTLLKILSRVTAPTSGRIRVKGRVASLLEVGTGFHPELTGRENIYLNGAILGMSHKEIDRKFDEIVDFAEIEKFIDTPVKRYSSGMYVRLAFAVAAHLEPEILVVDEVLAVGDAEFQKKCLGKMGDVAKEGRTVLFVSHNMVAMESLCEKICLIEKGKLKCIGQNTDIIDEYLNNNVTSSMLKQEGAKIDFNGITYTKKCIDDDIIIDLNFRTKDYSLNRVRIDIAVKNISGTTVIKLQSELVNKGFSLKTGRDYSISFFIHKPHLAPGKYFLDIYMKDLVSVLMYIRNIPAFDVEARSLKGERIFLFDKIGCIFPEFEVVCSEAQ